MYTYGFNWPNYVAVYRIQEEEAHFGKKRKFKDQKSFSIADFLDGATMVSTESKTEEPREAATEKILTDLEPKEFVLRKLQESVDDDFSGMFFRELMAQMHKMAPKFKETVHAIYSQPYGNIGSCAKKV